MDIAHNCTWTPFEDLFYVSSHNCFNNSSRLHNKPCQRSPCSNLGMTLSVQFHRLFRQHLNAPLEQIRDILYFCSVLEVFFFFYLHKYTNALEQLIYVFN